MRIGPAGSPGQFVGKSLTNAGPVLADGLSGQHPLRPPLKFLAPEGLNCCRVVSGRRIETGQQLGRHIGAIFLGQRERLSQKSLDLGSNTGRLQGRQTKVDTPDITHPMST